MSSISSLLPILQFPISNVPTFVHFIFFPHPPLPPPPPAPAKRTPEDNGDAQKQFSFEFTSSSFLPLPLPVDSVYSSGRLHIAHTTVAADPSAADIEFEFQISYHLIPWILFLAGLHIIWDFASFSLFFFLGFTAREILDCLWPKSGPSYADDIVSQSRVNLQMRGTSAAVHK